MKESLYHILSIYLKDELIDFIENNQDRFDELVALSLKNNPPHSSRAAWLLSKCVHQNDSRIKIHIFQYIKTLKIAIDGQQRDIINMLRKTYNYDDYLGELFATCEQIWCDTKKLSSTRVCALQLLLQVSEKHPELYQEIKLLTEERYFGSLSQGIKKSIKKQLLKYEANNKKGNYEIYHNNFNNYP